MAGSFGGGGIGGCSFGADRHTNSNKVAFYFVDKIFFGFLLVASAFSGYLLGNLHHDFLGGDNSISTLDSLVKDQPNITLVELGATNHTD